MLEVKIVSRRRRGKQKGLRYSLRWKTRKGWRWEAVGTDKVRARAVRQRKEDELNGLAPRRPATVTWETFVEEELAALKPMLEASSIRETERALCRFGEICEPLFVADVDVTMIERFRAKRTSERASPATINKDVRSLKASFNRAKARGYVQENPFTKVKLARIPDRDYRILDAEEEEKLLGACSAPVLYAFVYVALQTGARLGELLALEWADVELDTGRIYIRCKETWQTKSKRNRWVQVDGEGCRLLLALNQESQSRHVFRRDEVGKGYCRTFWHRFERAVRRAKIERCSIHDLRRTCLTRLAAAVTPAVLRAWAGHASIETTMKHYVRLEASRVLETVAAARGGVTEEAVR